MLLGLAKAELEPRAVPVVKGKENAYCQNFGHCFEPEVCPEQKSLRVQRCPGYSIVLVHYTVFIGIDDVAGVFKVLSENFIVHRLNFN